MKLVFIENNRPVTDSNMVSEVFGKRHDRVLQDVRDLGCSEEFRLHNFVESSYRNNQGREMPKIIMTEQGFAMLAMGYTGRAAMEFKEKYIIEFHRMRDEVEKSKIVPLDERKVRMELLKTAVDHEERIESIENEVKILRETVEEQITIDHGEQRRIQKAVARKVYEFCSDGMNTRELFPQLYREIKDRWAVASYRDVRRNEIDQVLQYIEAWKPKVA
ncbi:Rha family transcriptional regulator [Cohnella sp. GCM10027633]|uniref:Rha family transcriptional regulator n=1 Tax=unclassified Cohnella TaxID=2636738 RepID=UPI003628297B